MAQFNLTAPLTLNPAQATVLRLKLVRIDYDANPHQLILLYAYVDAGGNVVDTREITATDAAAQAYMTNQESNLLTRLGARLGTAGTVV